MPRKRILSGILAILLLIACISISETYYEPYGMQDSGEGVKALQEELILRGFLTGKADGQYGEGTASAVKAFQEYIGIEPTGTADAQTQEMLFTIPDGTTFAVQETAYHRPGCGLLTEPEYTELSSEELEYMGYTACLSCSPQTAVLPGETYVLNTNSRKFHYPYCASAKKIKNSNRMEFTGSREAVIRKGYEPCKRCKP